jgi:hypothetical protein
VSPRKPSTSSGKPSPDRPRYLGIEAAGGPFPPPKLLEAALRRALTDPASPASAPAVRVIRVEIDRAIAQIAHTAVPRARAGWNGPLDVPGRAVFAVRTRKTWGTLVGAKRWLRRDERR